MSNYIMSNYIYVAPQLGDIIVFNGNALFSKVQRLFTQRWIRGQSPKLFLPGNRTHSALGAGRVCNEPCILEAQEKVVVTAWSTIEHIPHRIYRIQAPKEVIELTMNSVFLKDTNQWYGFFWLPYFVFRKLMEKLFHKDVRKMRPWFPAGVICSEEVWLAFETLALYMKWDDLLSFINEWNGNNFHSSDTQSVLDAFPKYFELINSYKLDT